MIEVPRQGQPEYLDTSGLSFPVTGDLAAHSPTFGWQVIPPAGGGGTATLTATDVVQYFHNMYIAQMGYHSIRDTPSLQQNCFGYATGRNLWLTRSGFESVLNSGYKSYTRPEDFGGTVILENSGHAVLAETSKETVNEAIEGKIINTHEKNGPSGIYGRDLNLVYREIDGFYVGIMGGSASCFWKPK